MPVSSIPDKYACLRDPTKGTIGGERRRSRARRSRGLQACDAVVRRRVKVLPRPITKSRRACKQLISCFRKVTFRDYGFRCRLARLASLLNGLIPQRFGRRSLAG